VHKLILFVFILIIFIHLNSEVLTTLQGKVTDENKEPIPKARVEIEGTKIFTETNLKGNYIIHDIPSGKYDISCSQEEYGKCAVENEDVKINQNNTRDFLVLDGEKELTCIICDITGYGYIEKFKLLSHDEYKASQVFFESSVPVLPFTSSHYYLQRCIEFNAFPKPYIIRTEEMLNFYEYQMLDTTTSDSISMNIEYGNCPWNSDHNLVYVNLRVNIPPEKTKNFKNIVFLIDCSSSMREKESIPLIKDAFRPFLANLNEEDLISLIFYSGNRIIASSTLKAGNRHEILETFNKIDNNESSLNRNPLEMAYDTSRKNHLVSGSNIIVLISNDMYELGMTSDCSLIKTIEANTQENTYLKIALTSHSRINSEVLLSLVSKELAEYYCLDNLKAAKIFFISKLANRSYLLVENPVLSIEFNPLYVSEYRIIGYEEYLVDKRKIRDELPKDYSLISGESFVTAYEIIPTQRDSLIQSHNSEYTVNCIKEEYLNSDELMTAEVRFRDSEKQNVSISKQFSNEVNCLSNCSDNFKLLSGVIELSQVISDSPCIGISSIINAIELAESTSEEYNSFKKKDFVNICNEVTRLFELKQQKIRK